MLWGNKDYPTGNQKPKFANTSNVTSVSSIYGTAVANTNYGYGIVAGVSAGEETRSNGTPQHAQHAGWVSLKIGTGPIKSVSITSRGAGINANGFLVLTDTVTDSTRNNYAVGSGANISFTTANTQNTLQTFSTNSAWNGIGTLTIVNGGSGYSNTAKITYKVSNAANTTQPVLTLALGGRGGRIQTETLIAMGSITLDAPRDNAYFTGV